MVVKYVMPNRKNYKISPLKLKSLSITAGVNASNANQLKKISKADTKRNIPQVPMCDLYMRVDGTWTLKGKSCQLCGLLLSNPTVIDKHRYICETLNKNRDIDDDAPIRVTKGNRVYYTYKKG